MAHINSPLDQSAIDVNSVYLDTRTNTKKFTDMVKRPMGLFFVLLSASVICLYYPLISFAAVPFALSVLLINGLSRSNKVLPLKLPVDKMKGRTDYNENKPGSRVRFNKAGGVVYAGNERTTLKELWLTGLDYLTHMLYIATTGGGKTDTLVSMVSSICMTMGGGCIYVDAKAAVGLLYQFAAITRLVGREEKLRVISFNSGGPKAKLTPYESLSNTNQPFAKTTSSVAVQIIEGMMPGGNGEDGYFKDRALVTLSSLFPCLTELRDFGLINITPSLIAEFAQISKMCQIAYPEHFDYEITYKKFGDAFETTIPNKVTELARESIKGFLKNLPEFSESPEAIKDVSKQPEQVEKQFGFGKGYFLKALASLGATYGHIYECELGEADYSDCILNNRVLLIMVPATQESKDRREMLGKLSLSSIRLAMSEGLGFKSEGDYEDVVANLPVDKKTPSLIVVDEYPEVAVPGFAVAATQGRGLGTACVFSGQDFPGFIRADENEAKMIFANTRLKYLGTLEDPKTTLEYYSELAGKVRLAEVSGFDSADRFGFKRESKAQIKEVSKLNIESLSSQVESEVHILHKGRVIRADLFHFQIDEKKARNLRLNRLLQITTPTVEDRKKFLENAKNIVNLIDDFKECRLPNRNHASYFEGVEITKDTQWIYDLLSVDLLKPAQNKNGNIQTAHQTKEKVEIKSHPDGGMPGMPKNEKGKLTSLLNKGEVGRYSSNSDNATHIPPHKANDSYVHLLDFVTSRNKVSRAQKMENELSSLIAAAGITTSKANSAAIKTIDTIRANSKYTSIDIKPELSDLDTLNAALDDLEGATDDN